MIKVKNLRMKVNLKNLIHPKMSEKKEEEIERNKN